MRARTVIITMEVETDATVNDLKQRGNWSFGAGGSVFEIRQIQRPNVIVGTKPKGKKKAKG